MRMVPYRFAGYGPGDYDFQARLIAAEDETRQSLGDALDRVADTIVQAPAGRFFSLVVVGYSDRQDAAGLSHEARRASEEAASQERADSAWEFLKNAISAKAGGLQGEWWDDSPNITWALIGAGATRLTHGNPASEGQRSENRRLVILLSEFGAAT